jgi:hypothetical protein
MSCQFTPTVTIALSQYEILSEYQQKYFSIQEDVELWKERYNEATKMLAEQEEELSRLRQLESWLGERFDSDE